MPANFLNGITGKLAENWIANLLTPAFAFWMGGLGAWIWRFGWRDLETWFVALSEPTQIATLIIGFLIVTVSAAVLQRFDLVVIRLLEGYWPRFLNPLKQWLTRRQLVKQRRASYRLQCLKRKRQPGLTAKELARYQESYWPVWLRSLRQAIRSNRYSLSTNAQLTGLKTKPIQQHVVRPYRHRVLLEQQDHATQKKKRFHYLKQRFKETYATTSLTFEEWNEYETLRLFFQAHGSRQSGLTAHEAYTHALLESQLKHFPTQPERMMPTRLGNILRAAEGRPSAKYGLDSIICWPALWLVLPDAAKTELQAARAALDRAIRLWLWSVMFVVWTQWAWWALPAGLLAAVGIYYSWILQAATTYGQLLEAAFDTHRAALYKALRFTLPQTLEEETPIGKDITAYLWQGARSERLKFDGSTSDATKG